MIKPLKPAVGDRVRLAHANGDAAIITVVEFIPATTAIRSTNNYFVLSEDEWSVAEILESALPTEVGVYALNEHLGPAHTRYLARAGNGAWYWFDLSYNGTFAKAHEDHVAKFAKTMKKVL